MKNIKQMIHPYIFVLKEGTNIEENRFDYNLLMLKVLPTEHFRSPENFTVSKPVRSDAEKEAIFQENVAALFTQL